MTPEEFFEKYLDENNREAIVPRTFEDLDEQDIYIMMKCYAQLKAKEAVANCRRVAALWAADCIEWYEQDDGINGEESIQNIRWEDIKPKGL